MNIKSKTLASVTIGGLMVFLVTGCGITGPAHKMPDAKAAAVIDMGLMNYTPNNVVIRTGDTVEWRNTSIITHTVTDDPRQAQKSKSASVPYGAKGFNSGDILAGQVYTHTFTKPGIYRYFCVNHEEHNMVGTVIVK